MTEVNVGATVAAGLASSDPSVRAKAAAYKSWQIAEGALAAAAQDLATEETKLDSRRADLANKVKDTHKGLEIVTAREQVAIDAATKRIADAAALVTAAQAVLVAESKEHEVVLAALKAGVAAAKAAAARAEGAR